MCLELIHISKMITTTKETIEVNDRKKKGLRRETKKENNADQRTFS